MGVADALNVTLGSDKMSASHRTSALSVERRSADPAIRLISRQRWRLLVESDEDRVYMILCKLGGYGTSDRIAKELGWEDKGGARRVGQIMARLIQRGRVERFDARCAYHVKNGGLLNPSNKPDS